MQAQVFQMKQILMLFYNEPGVFDVSLTVENESGSDTKLRRKLH